MPSNAMQDEEWPNENWPDKELVVTILRQLLRDPKVNVTEFRSKIATNNGDCYSSHIFRVDVKCEQRKDTLTLIFKRLIDVNYSGEAYATPFVRETMMLKDVLPQMYSVLKDVVPGMEPIGPRYIHSASEGVIVMENLQQEGFQMTQRRLGLDLNHCSLVLRTLARYHAASILLLEQKSLNFSVFRKSIFGESNVIFGNFCNGMLRALAEEVRHLKGLERFTTKLAAFAADNFHKVLEKAIDDHEDDEFLVLSHGDLWVNNIMFRHSLSGEPGGVRFVDFQLPCITNPCIDIQYFLTTSCNEDVRTAYTDQLLEEYHKTLCEVMAALKCSTSPPALEKLKNDYDRKSHLGMYALICVMPLMFSEPTQLELSQIAVGGKPKAELFTSELYKKVLKWFLPLYERKGYL